MSENSTNSHNSQNSTATYPTYSGLDEEQKVLNFLWIIQLEKGRGAILIFSLVFYTVMWNYASGIFGLSDSAMGLILGPVAALSMIVAVFKPKGHYLEWWAGRWLTNLTRPSILLFKRRDPDNPLKAVRDSVQDAIPLQKVEWQWLKTDDGTYVIVFRVEPYSVSMASEDERRRLWQGAISYYRRLDYPVIEMSRNRPGSTTRYQRHVYRVLTDELRQTEKGPAKEALAAYGEAHLQFAARVGKRYAIQDLSTYLLVPYNPEAENGARRPTLKETLGALRGGMFRRGKGTGKGKGKPNTYTTEAEQRKDEEAYAVLSVRAAMVYESISQMGCRVHALTDTELLAFFASQSTDCDEDPDEPPVLEEPIMLEAGGYERLSEEKIRKNVSVAESVRENSPPTVGTATLTVKDSVSPDAIVRHPDYVIVGGRYHKTRYVSRWCEDAHMGMISPIESLDGRIKVLKYIHPKDQEEAIRRYGNRVGELDAAVASDTSGNVVSKRKKETAQYNAHLALNEITQNRQGYVRLAVFIHLEADSLEELSALDYKVWRILNSRSIQTRIATEEAWEGFLTCLPLARNCLTASTDSGMMTNALACLMSFTTPHIQHDGGILLGLDLDAGGMPVIYDDWQMDRPGSVTLGPPNTGKTFSTKADSTRKRALGHRIVILDPSANSYYNHVARSIGGEYAFLAEGSPHKINPFDLHSNYMSLALMTDAFAESVDDPEQVTQRARASALNGKVEALTGIVELMAGGLGAAETGFVEGALYESYRRAGITNDPATHTNTPPTFSGGNGEDFFNVLGEKAEESPQVVGGLLERLRSWMSGPMAGLFDSQTNVDLTNKYLVLQIAALQSKAKPVVMHAIMEFTSGILSNPDEIADFYTDEFHNLLYNETSAKYAEDWYRTARVRATSVHAISQDTEEFAASRSGRVIMNQAGTARIFNQGNEAAASAVANIYGLSEPEKDLLQNLGQGVCYFIAGRSRHTLQVLASPEEEALFDTSPGSDTRHRTRKANAAAAEDALTSSPAHPPVEIPEEFIPKDPAMWDAPNEVDEVDEIGEDFAESATSATPTTPDQAVANAVAEENEDGAANSEPIEDSFPEDLSTEEPSLAEQVLAELPALPGEAADEPTRIYAFTGEGAPQIAATVARLLGEEASRKELFVMAVDATTPGGELGSELGIKDGTPPDRYLAAGHADADSLFPYVRQVCEDHPALMAVSSPELDILPASALIEAATGTFDIIVVACGAAGSTYSGEWLLAADTVVGCSSKEARSALGAALSAEASRGTNGTLLATHAEAPDAAELGAEAADRVLFTSLTADPQARLALTTQLITGHHAPRADTAEGRMDEPMNDSMEESIEEPIKEPMKEEALDE